MSDERAQDERPQQMEENRIEDLPLKPMSDAEESTVNGGAGVLQKSSMANQGNPSALDAVSNTT